MTGKLSPSCKEQLMTLGAAFTMQREFTSRALLAERILNLAVKGERNPERLRDAALAVV
jgi:hypothetical protein